MGTATHNDSALLVHICGGARAALVALYDRYSAILLGLARTMVGGGIDADELVHDVFVDVWRQPNRYRPHHGTVRAWLVLQLRQRALEALQAAPELAVQIPEGRFARPPATSRQACWRASQQAFASERLAAHEALADLPSAQRRVLELAYFGRRSLVDIATHLSLPIEVVRNHLAVAHHDLREALHAVRR